MSPHKFYWVNGGILLAGIAVLLTAFFLTPDPRGMGTHEHLFLPPCFFHWLTQIPCPSCGLTTSFAYLAKGQWSQGFHIHPLGPPLFLVFLSVIGLALMGLLSGRPLWRWLDRPSSIWLVSLVLLVWLTTWGIRVLSHERLLITLRSF